MLRELYQTDLLEAVSNTVATSHMWPFRRLKCGLVGIEMCLWYVIHTGSQSLSRKKNIKYLTNNYFVDYMFKMTV